MGLGGFCIVTSLCFKILMLLFCLVIPSSIYYLPALYLLIKFFVSLIFTVVSSNLGEFFVEYSELVVEVLQFFFFI
ncbi:hypothetical protein DsansV1_C35g0230601 [Dioscorea sansibarensis]